jgi:hypothetical protein
VALKYSSGGVHLVWLIAFVAACGTGGPLGGSGSTTGSTVPTNHKTTVSSPTESTAPATSSSGEVSTAAESAATPNVLQSFVETWNRIAVNQDRNEWLIEPWLPLGLPSSPENTHGIQVSLGGEPPQLVVDAVATGERLVSLEIAVLRLDDASVNRVEDAFRIGVMTAAVTEDASEVDGLITELVEQAMLSPADPTETVELPGGVIAGSFSTDAVYVLGIRWPSD